MMTSATRHQKNSASSIPEAMINRSRSAGFTLLELLVVILIIGLMTSFVTLNYPESDPVAFAKTETKKLAYLIRLASEDSLMRSRPVSLHLTPTGYRFLIRTKSNLWVPSKDKLFTSQKMPKGVTIELNLSNDEGQFSAPTEETPQILLSTSGELTPFKIRMVTSQTTKFSELRGQFGGQLTIRHYPLPNE